MLFPSKLDFARGEIISLDLDPVPQVGHPHENIAEKRNNPEGECRSCIVVRPMSRREDYGMSIVVPLRTLKEKVRLFEGDVRVPVSAGVKEESVAEVSQLRAVDLNKRLKAWFGVIDDKKVLAELDKALKKVLGL